MTKEELLARFGRHEWSDVEFKKAQHGAPEDAYRTVSAFANTSGGTLVFGVSETRQGLQVTGVEAVDKVQNEFLSCLRSVGRLNRVIQVTEELFDVDGRTVLAFYVPESPRSAKPIYLKGNPQQSYVRRGGGDERCTSVQIERFLRDASGTRYDGELFPDFDAEEFFDDRSVPWYRRVFDEKNPGRGELLTDLEFLNEWGFVVESGDRLVPTRAAVLLFGQGRYVRQILPRAVVDYQWINADFDDWSPDKRWDDRVVIEENISNAWLTLVERYMKHAERPFSLDAATLRRQDVPPDYVSFREAAINLLIHQDYGDHTRKPVIKFFRDRTVFWNPGDAFATTEQLLEPTEKEVRNPLIVAAFRRIGLSDQAGTGVRSIFSSWQSLGNVPPEIHNDKTDKTYELVLRREPLISDEQRRFQQSLGAHLSDHQASLLAYACRSGSINLMDAKAITGRKGADARQILDSLVTQVLLKPLDAGELYEVADHLRERLVTAAGGEAAARAASDQVHRKARDLVSDQVRPPAKLTAAQQKLLALCGKPRSLAELMEHVGVTHRTFFRRKNLKPLLDAGILKMTNPENPQAANQKYVLTKAGAAWWKKRRRK